VSSARAARALLARWPTATRAGRPDEAPPGPPGSGRPITWAPAVGDLGARTQHAQPPRGARQVRPRREPLHPRHKVHRRCSIPAPQPTPSGRNHAGALGHPVIMSLTARVDSNTSRQPTTSTDQAIGNGAGCRRCQTASNRPPAILVPMVQVRILPA
jgi:hypothetical protein